ncbi:MAG: hypothetical protein KAJ63_10530 [Methyloprofundus sp.]|nr:hypothetical protein [Methyloprofundus sp.]
MFNQIKDFLKNEEGAETLEYVVIVAIILVLGAAAYNTGFGAVITQAFSAIISAVAI